MTTKEEMVKIEEDAKELVKNLKSLHEQVGSYKQAGDELEKATTQLGAFIEDTQKLTEESHKIIKVINDIGSASIFEKLGELDEKTNSISKKAEELAKKNRQRFILLIGGLSLVICLEIVMLIVK